MGIPILGGFQRHPLRCVLSILAALAGPWIPLDAVAAESAVILMYHRFGEDEYPTTNIRIEQFEAHIAELARGPYTVLPVPEIVAALRDGRELPDRTVGITIDDAYRSIFTEAWPRLRAAGLAFTVFVATDPVDRGLPGYLSWAQIRQMKEAGVTIGAHTASHPHMPDRGAAENRGEIARSLARFEAELGERPELFAYPYGETSAAVREVVGTFGFDAAFGQQSGAVHRTADRDYLPRFALNEKYGVFDDFRLKINTIGLPVSDLIPQDPYLPAGNPPTVGFSVDSSIGRLDSLACYHSQFGKVDVDLLGKRRVELRFPGPFKAGRTRLNCTLPAGGGRWRWFGMQFYAPRR